MVVASPRQLSLFDADVAEVGPRDLEGLLAGPGQVVRLGGTARVSVVVTDEWRARTLLAEYALRGVTGTGAREAPPGGGPDDPSPPGEEPAVADEAGTEVAAVEGHISVRTAFSACLAPLAARWLRGAVTRPPDDFELDGPMLRLWYIAAGRAVGPAGRHSQGVVLRLSATDEAAWPAVGAALRRLGLPGALLGPRAGGPAYRIVGRRRVARFAELIGTAPATVPAGGWPTVSARTTTGISAVGVKNAGG